MVSVGTNIEIPLWSDLKTLIDGNPKFTYDHAIANDVNQLLISVRQSNDITYFTWIDTGTSDYTDYINNYAAGASRGVDSAINVTTTFADSFNLDAFSRLRTGQPHSLFDSVQIYDDQPLFWENIITGGASATYNYNISSTRLACTTASGDKVIRQTREYFKYQPGKSLRIAMTGLVGEAKSGVVKRLGYYDDGNGVFFEQTSTGGLFLVRRTNTSGSVTETRVPQSEWNVDTLDGNGKTQVTLDITKAQIFLMDVQWLGVGRVRMGFSIDGAFYYAHQFFHANLISEVYMRAANLPLRYELENTSTTDGTAYMDHICVSVESEGGYNPKGVTRIASTGVTHRTVGAAYVPIIAIRLKSNYNRAHILPVSFKGYNESNTLVHMELLHDVTLTGASWVSLDPHSIAEYDVSATAFSGGEVLDDMFVSSQGADRNQLAADIPEMLLKIVSNYAGTSQILALVGRSDGAASSVYGTMTFREVY